MDLGAVPEPWPVGPKITFFGLWPLDLDPISEGPERIIRGPWSAVRGPRLSRCPVFVLVNLTSKWSAFNFHCSRLTSNAATVPRSVADAIGVCAGGILPRQSDHGQRSTANDPRPERFGPRPATRGTASLTAINNRHKKRPALWRAFVGVGGVSCSDLAASRRLGRSCRGFLLCLHQGTRFYIVPL